MRPNPLLVVVSIVYFIVGLALTFAPQELLAWLGAPSSHVSTWLTQLLGGALFALGFLNWFLRFTAMGGIHGRPLLVTNLSFFAIAFSATLKQWQAQGGPLFAAAAVLTGALLVIFAQRLLSRS